MDLYTNGGNIRLGKIAEGSPASPCITCMHDYCFPSMHVSSGDLFVSFKAGGRDGSLFFYCVGYHTAGRNERPKKNSHKKIVLLLFFLVVGDKLYPFKLSRALSSLNPTLFCFLMEAYDACSYLCVQFDNLHNIFVFPGLIMIEEDS